EEIVAGSPGDVVAAEATGDRVVAVTAIDGVGPLAASEDVIAGARLDDEAAIGLGRTVEGELVAGGEDLGQDGEGLAGANRGVVGGEFVVVAGGEIEGLDIGQRGSTEGDTGGVIAVEHERVGAAAAIDGIGGGQAGGHVDGVIATAAMDGVVA